MAYNSYCRLCATFTPEVDLIDIIGNKNGLEMKIEQCFQLKIENDNFIPKQACILCASKVHSSYDFHMQIQKSQLVFKSSQTTILVNTKEEINDELDVKFDLNNSNSSDKFSGDEYDGGGPTFDDFDEEMNDIKHEPKQSNRKKSKNGGKDRAVKETNDFTIEEESLSDIEEMRKAFHKKVSEISVKSFNHLISDEMYARLIREVEEAETKTTRATIENKRLNRFEIYIENGVKKLILRRHKSTDKIQYFVPNSQLFELIRDAHLKLNHGGRCRIEHVLRMKYKSLSRDLIMAYLNLCIVCQKRKQSVNERTKLKAKENKEKVVTRPPAPALKCNVCNKMLHTANELSDHFETVHNKPVEFTCLECSRSYGNYITYRNHLLSHKNRFRFRCETCDKFFSSNTKLQSHKLRHNQVRKKYYCSTCGKGFLDKTYLNTHEKRAHTMSNGIPDPKFTCDVCSKEFTSISNLNNHKKVHTGVREHTCEHCGKSFFYKKCLDHHMTTHSDERPFVCDTCPARFKTKTLLRQHVFLHTGIKPFQCHICGKKFRRKPALLEHAITHTNLYPFKCEICGKGFRHKKNVVWHQRLHTGEKPYSCEACNRHFACLSYYDKHMKRNHGVVKVKKEFPSGN